MAASIGFQRSRGILSSLGSTVLPKTVGDRLMAPPPLLGFNNNVRHRGKIFHIQTEDSGVERPRIVTHLFADGGRIIKTTRTDYSEHLGRDDMSAVVRGLMKEQHKAMFIALRAGELDDLLAQANRGEGATAPLNAEREPSHPGVVSVVPSSTGSDRSARSVKPSSPARGRRSNRASARAKQRAGRYAASRPAAIFGDAPPSKNIFGDEVISEKSLDEVILSYLADDLDDPVDEG